MPIDRWAKRSILWRGCLWKKNGKLRCSWNAYEHDFRWKIRGVSKRADFVWETPIFELFHYKDKVLWEEAIDRKKKRKIAYEFMLHYSWTVHTDDPNADLATDPELLQIIDGNEWNEFDVQHLRDFWTFS